MLHNKASCLAAVVFHRGKEEFRAPASDRGGNTLHSTLSRKVPVRTRSRGDTPGRPSEATLHDPSSSPSLKRPRYADNPLILRMPPSPQFDVRSTADAVAADLCALVAEQDGWEPYKTRRGVRIERCRAAALHRWRAFGSIDAPLLTVVEAASKVASRPDWDPMCAEGRLVEEAGTVESASYSVAWWVFKGVMGLVNARDMCVAMTVKEVRPGVWVTASRSIEHPACPEVESIPWRPRPRALANI